jgi:hypothetical protein
VARVSTKISLRTELLDGARLCPQDQSQRVDERKRIKIFCGVGLLVAVRKHLRLGVVRWSDSSRIHFPASLRSTVVTRFLATTDALTPAGRLFGPYSHERRLSPSGLPDYCAGTSGHSVSNHRCVDRRSSDCQRVLPAATVFAFR